MHDFTCGGFCYTGLVPLVVAYDKYINNDLTTKDRLLQYLDLVEGQAMGRLVTPATWMRQFVWEHPA